jgi:Uma2 family endonuclease
MATSIPRGLADALPGHLELQDHNDTIGENFRELPQSLLLTDSILPILRAKHPDGRFAIGQDCGIYWKLVDPPQRGAVCPDWFYVPDVPSDLDGHYRRSYVLWKEPTRPSIVLEFASGDGSEERDQTPGSGKFWIYKRIVIPEYYGIFNVESGDLEFFQLSDGRYQSVAPNARGGCDR